jgi:hypothetical protein
MPKKTRHPLYTAFKLLDSSHTEYARAAINRHYLAKRNEHMDTAKSFARAAIEAAAELDVSETELYRQYHLYRGAGHEVSHGTVVHNGPDALIARRREANSRKLESYRKRVESNSKKLSKNKI